ncbi:expressed unknown protein [Seminavis robusta]|uniref:RXYLT1 C-terminal domain-containing protein n=1 Tax=Seminavis robusta TaxID=568900 RepID=A0A9N8F1B0_9STRA|nr:expressed unknown protein [Seminavis robusta]|eukprot:Sro3071_g343160.1 n/a (338) ;mRNA; r:4789-5922
MKDLEMRFHTQRLQVLQNVEESNLLDWGARQDFHQYLDHFEFYVLNRTADPSPPLHRLTNYSYFHLPDEDGPDGLCWAATLFYKYYQQPNATALSHVLFAYLSRDWGAFSVEWTHGLYLHPNYTRRLEIKQKESSVNSHLTSGLIQRQQPYQPRPVLLYISYQKWDFRIRQLQSLHKRLQVPNSYERLLGLDNVHPDAWHPLSRARRIRRGILLFWRHKLRRLPLNSDMQHLQDGMQYLHNISQAKFMLSPVGWGMDCYRNYEMLYMGTIPVIETRNRTHDRWFRIFDALPVAFIDHYDNLTNEWLEAEYRRILQGSYRWEKLTKQYWVKFTKAFME